MAKNWKILFCDGRETACPVAQFINQCEPRHRVKVMRFLSLLEEKGPILPRPYADILHDGIHELRFNLSSDRIRVLYFFCYQKFIVLYYAFFKNTQKVPEKLIDKVQEYRESFLEKTSKEMLEDRLNASF